MDSPETPASVRPGPGTVSTGKRLHSILCLQAGDGPFLQRCYTSSLASDTDGSLLLYRSARDEDSYRTFVSRLRAPSLGWRDLPGSDHLGQGLWPAADDRLTKLLVVG